MRIGIDARLISGRFTGDRTYWRGLLRGLSEISADGNDEFFLYVRQMPAQDEIDTLSLSPNFSWHIVPAANDRAWSLLALPSATKRDRVDMVHVQYTVSPFFTVPVVCTVHDISFKLFPELFALKDRALLNMTVPFSVRHARAVITVSDNTRRDVIKTYHLPPQKAFTTHLAADECYVRLTDSERDSGREKLMQKYGIEGSFVLAVGVLQPRKNVPMLLQAFRAAKILSGFPHKLVITGKRGWLTKEIDDSLGKAAGKDSAVLMTGYVPDSDLPLLYNCADLLCYPSLYEGFGLPPLEAMACGCPVLASNVSSLPEVVGDAGMTADPKNPGAWIDAITEILGSAKLRESMSANGLVQADKFNWRNTANATYAAYKFAAGQ